MIVNSILVLLLGGVCLPRAYARKSSTSQMSDRERAIVFAVSEEDFANQLENRKDVCVAFSTELDVNQKSILAELKRGKLSVHAYSWCSKQPTGFIIFVGRVAESSPEMYEVTIDLSDDRPILEQSAHFATLVRRGTYIVKCKAGSPAELVRYVEAPPTKKPCVSEGSC
jgi:hypothetical protein